MAQKIKKDDMVRVIAGKDIDKEGKVIAVDRKHHRVIVEGVNMLTKHTKPSMQNQAGRNHSSGRTDRRVQRNASAQRSADKSRI